MEAEQEVVNPCSDVFGTFGEGATTQALGV